MDLRTTLAQNLLMHVYYRLSAAVSLDASGHPSWVRMFDTEFGSMCMRVAQDADEVWLMSNHPEGQTSLYEADMNNLMLLRAAAPKARLRVFVVNEDTGCTEIDLEGTVDVSYTGRKTN